jgi:hypothetical protein
VAVGKIRYSNPLPRKKKKKDKKRERILKQEEEYVQRKEALRRGEIAVTACAKTD